MRPDSLLASWSWPSRRAARVRAHPARRLAWAGTAALLLVAPFELIDVRLVLPGQTITNVEAVLAAALGAWLLAVLAGGGDGWRTSVTRPALMLAGILLVAALVAPAHRVNALKFVGRFAAGFGVCLLAANAAPTPRNLFGLMRAALASGVVIGVVALLEYLQVPSVLQWLQHFRDSSHAVGGTPRMSATLQYPTIASMYLEVVFAFGLALLVQAVDRMRPIATVLLVLALTVVGEAIILTLTRAGLVSMAVATALVAGGLIGRRGLDRAARAVMLVSASVVACLIVTWSTQPLWLRLTSEGQEGWYRASYTAPAFLRLRSNAVQRVSLGLRNEGRVAWRPDEESPFRVSYHWLTEDGRRVLQFDGLRTDLPRLVAPGESTTVLVTVHAPPARGRYRLAWDIVQEGRLWFSTENSPSAMTPVEVWGEPEANAPFAWRTIALPPANVRLGRLALWRLAIGMLAARPLLGVGPDNFRLLYGARAGLDQADPRVHTNDMYIEMFVGAGLLGGATFLWLLYRVVASLAAAARSAAGARYTAWLGVTAAVGVTLVHGLVDSFLTFTPTYVLIWIALGFAVSLGRQAGKAAHADRV